ncbi:hypothetical protein M1D72_19680 [Vibrio sp. AK197]|uniref:YtxH domain-containing protein n=1 Tax=Vibrio olivae TaxID=1243002 RepID=A0ABV5HP96_9VIBR
MKTTMKTALMTLLFSAFTLGLTACTDDGPAENAGEQVDQTMSEASDQIDDTMTDAGNAIEDTCEDVKEGVDAQDTDC